MHQQFSRRGWFGLVASTLATRSVSASDVGPSVSSRIRRFLMKVQNQDGSWRSQHYGVLKSGQAMTPFVLHTLLRSTQDQPGVLAKVRQPAERAVSWMESRLRQGCLGVADTDVLEYPVYATSWALRCVQLCLDTSIIEESTAVPMIAAMRGFLIEQQFDESNGFTPTDLPYGGWGFGGSHPAGVAGHMDLAHSRYALQALAETGGVPLDVGQKSLTLLRLLQKHPSETREQPLGQGLVSTTAEFDGGFYFSPVVLGANKGRMEETKQGPQFRSYATATCEGVLALQAAGLPTDDPRVQAAKRWFLEHPSWNYPEGIPKQYPEPWGDAVTFYHQSVRAEAYRVLQIDDGWEQALRERIALHLRRDGSVVNQRSGLMKEDDPLLASTLALIALNA
ncbi:MAG: hypothetical protein AAGA03_01700 [Planctomycetota bacterium]